MSYIPGLHYGWWDEQQCSHFFQEMAAKAPSLLLHGVLDGLEARIVARLVAYYGDEYGRTLWETAIDVEGDDEIRAAVERAWLINYRTLFSFVAKRNWAERVGLLRGEAA